MNLLIFNLRTDADDSVLGFTTAWINALAKRYATIVVITMAAGRLDVADNVTVYSVGKERGFSEPRRLYEFYRILWGVLRDHRIDTCFAHMMPVFAVAGWPLLKYRDVPISLWYTHAHVSRLLRVATLLVDQVVSAGRSSFGIATSKVQFVGHGIDVERFTPAIDRAPNGKCVLLSVGRISPVKHLEDILDAVAQLSIDTRRSVEVRLVGDAHGADARHYLDVLRRKADKLGLADIVRFLPGVPFHRIVDVYRDADVFLNTSRTRSVDKAVLEAMSCGLMVVTTNIAFREVLSNAFLDEFVLPDAGPMAVAGLIETITALDPSERRIIGQRLREIVVRDHSLNSLTLTLQRIFPRRRV